MMLFLCLTKNNSVIIGYDTALGPVTYAGIPETIAEEIQDDIYEYLNTENGDRITTEAGDPIIRE